jgi:hypothetical protein
VSKYQCPEYASIGNCQRIVQVSGVNCQVTTIHQSISVWYVDVVSVVSGVSEVPECQVMSSDRVSHSVRVSE